MNYEGNTEFLKTGVTPNPSFEGASSGLPTAATHFNVRPHNGTVRVEERRLQMRPNPSIERTSSGRLRLPTTAAHVKP